MNDLYIDYSRLWKLLIDKGIKKTDLIELAGISSRTLSKLSKNQTVTTDTVLRVCSALHCGVSDIMEIAEKKTPASVYEAYRRFAVTVEENELYKTETFEFKNESFVVFSSKKSANKATHIHCRDNSTVYWEELYPFGGMSTPYREERVLIKPIADGERTAIVLILGKPGIITGLDEGIFVSANGKRKNKSSIYVMSMAAFKLFRQE